MGQWRICPDKSVRSRFVVPNSQDHRIIGCGEAASLLERIRSSKKRVTPRPMSQRFGHRFPRYSIWQCLSCDSHARDRHRKSALGCSLFGFSSLHNEKTRLGCTFSGDGTARFRVAVGLAGHFGFGQAPSPA